MSDTGTPQLPQSLPIRVDGGQQGTARTGATPQTPAQPLPEQPAPDPRQAAAQRSSETPVDVELRQSGSQRASVETSLPYSPQVQVSDAELARLQSIFPEQGSLVRLEAVSPAQLEALVTQQQLNAAQAVATQLPAALPPILDTLPPLSQLQSPLTTPPQTLPSLQASTQILLNSGQTLNATLPQVSLTLEAANNLALPNNSTAQQSVISTQIQPPQTLTAFSIQDSAFITTVQNVTAQSSALNETAPSTSAFDARVGTISLPPVALAEPQSLQTSAPTVPQNSILTTQNAAQISAVVVAQTPENIPVLQFSIPTGEGFSTQSFALQFPSEALITGSRIDLTPQAVPDRQTLLNLGQGNQTQALPTLPFANIAFPQAWPIMQDIQQSLTQLQSQQQQNATAQVVQGFQASLPSPGNAAQFGAAVMFFVSAMRGGDASQWLGRNASEALQNLGKSSLLSRLPGEALSARGGEATQTDWRGINIPMFWEGDIQKVALHYKQDAGQGENEQAQGLKGTRFLFDLSLDVMGKVQVDGFFRPASSDGARMDIVLRTEERFSGAMQAEMRRLYMDALKPSQLGGELSFQDGLDAWVMIDAQDASALGVSA